MMVDTKDALMALAAEAVALRRVSGGDAWVVLDRLASALRSDADAVADIVAMDGPDGALLVRDRAAQADTFLFV
ncbi:hypothetical protein GCM10017083_04950 [Thalassobaculum fulvum]|uniref:Uncharacterized protein n=1 Tax=Thalassobaculum fulvum TaxID=1633335 RepID=A0A918XPL4_9PROT|nr:hypothetical protein [Thalassobaculum fulvum]GHD41053.1 hypothetical protein GCM10017083_04950 [Thalassobaculum fulvum]